MNTNFTPNIGSGFLFCKIAQPDNHSTKARTKHEVSVWRGHMTLPGNIKVQLRAKHSTRKDQYEVTVHDFNNWATLGECTIPSFHDQDYQDSQIKIGDRAYTIRFIRLLDKGYIKVSLPQVLNATRAAQYMR